MFAFVVNSTILKNGPSIELVNASSKVFVDLFKETNELLRMFYELFYKFSEEKGDVFTRKYKELKVQSLRLLGQTTKEENRVVHYLDFLINRTYEIAGPYYAMQL